VIVTVNVELLRRVSNAPGISGFEDAIQDIVIDNLSASCQETRRDRLGNVIGFKPAQAPVGGREPIRVMLAAHADEIGMMVKHIDPEGYIRIQAIGGLHAPSLVSQVVTIHGREAVQGVVVPDMDDPEKAPSVEEVAIDLGLPRDEVCQVVEVGDPITYAQEMVVLNDRVFMGRNFDDRIGTYCLLETMNRLGPTQVDVYAVSTVQEEVGVRGAPVAAYAIEPHIGLAIDGSLCHGPYPRSKRHTTEMGLGTGIYIMDRLTIGDPRLVRFLLDLCEQHTIPYQRDIWGGTDASAIQRTKEGALATTVGAPVRYMHSTVQLCHARDIEATVDLLTTFLEHAHEMAGDIP
jgi:putative aminopeptidase FrvX